MNEHRSSSRQQPGLWAGGWRSKTNDAARLRQGGQLDSSPGPQYTELGWAVSPLKGVWQPGAALLQASHSGRTAGPRTGFPLLRLGDTASIGGETVFATGKYLLFAGKASVRCVECWCSCAGLLGVAGSLVRSCAALSAWSRLQHSALAANSRYTIHTDTHTV